MTALMTVCKTDDRIPHSEMSGIRPNRPHSVRSWQRQGCTALSAELMPCALCAPQTVRQAPLEVFYSSSSRSLDNILRSVGIDNQRSHHPMVSNSLPLGIPPPFSLE